MRVLPLIAAALGGVAGTAGLARLLAGYVVKQMTAAGPMRPALRFGFTPFDTGVAWEDVSFPNADGTLLGGWLLPRDPAAPAVLACGGYRGKRSDLLGISSTLWRAGFTVLLFDYHGYGETPGSVTLGHHELRDAQAALRFLRQRRPDVPLGVIGFSMGAAVALMLAAREADVRAVVADSPFTSQREIVRYRIGRQVLSRILRPVQERPSRLGRHFMSLVLSEVDRQLAQRFGFRLDDVQPMRDVARLAGRPLLLVHGEDDEVIPVEHGRQMDRAARDAGVAVESWIVPGAGHCGAYFVDRAVYCERVTSFFQRHLIADRNLAGGGEAQAASVA